jgi:hypothetical protein
MMPIVGGETGKNGAMEVPADIQLATKLLLRGGSRAVERNGRWRAVDLIGRKCKNILNSKTVTK